MNPPTRGKRNSAGAGMKRSGPALQTCTGARLCQWFTEMRTKNWSTVPVIMMDFEGTTTSGVVEYGVVVLGKGRVLSADTALCAPTGSIADRERAVHGIGDRDVRGREPFSSRYDQFVGYRRQGVFAAHNRHAENQFLKSTWALPPRVPDWRRMGEGEAQEWGPWIDTLAIYKAVYPSLSSCALGDLVEAFQLRPHLEALAGEYCPDTRRKPHCALYDALASALLLLRLDEESALYGHLSLSWLLQFSRGQEPQRELF